MGVNGRVVPRCADVAGCFNDMFSEIDDEEGFIAVQEAREAVTQQVRGRGRRGAAPNRGRAASRGRGVRNG
jgi:hypothetical protein